MAVAFDTTRGSTTNVTYSNNDTTVTFDSSGSQEMFCLTGSPTHASLLGSYTYFEFTYNLVGSTPLSMVFGIITDQTTAAELDTVSRVGKMVSTVTLNQADNETLFYNTGPWVPGSTSSSQHHPQGADFPTAVVNGDNFGFLIGWGTDPDYPFAITTTVFLNGRAISRARETWPGGNDFGDRTYTPAVWIQIAAGSENTSLDLVQQTSWVNEPDVVPSVQEWATSKVTPAIADNKYCRLQPVLRYGNDITGSTTRDGMGYLSNKNLTIETGRSTSASVVNLWEATGSTARASGKYYWEFTVDRIAGTLTNTGGGSVGFVSGGLTSSDNNSLDRNKCGWVFGSNVIAGAGDRAYAVGTAGGTDPLFGGDLPDYRPQAGDVFMLAIDIPSAIVGNSVSFWVGKNGTWANNTPGVGAGDAVGPVALGVQPWQPYIQFQTGASYTQDAYEGTANFGASAFSYTVPAGFLAWDDTPVPS